MDICFDAELLKRLCDAAVKFSDADCATIRLRFFDSNSAMRFDMVNSDGQEMNGLVMPLRGSVEPKFNKPGPPKVCIGRNCRKPFDASLPETRSASELRSFWTRYCPDCRTKGNAGSPAIVEEKKPVDSVPDSAIATA
jgi:hypothetical protein